MKPSGTTQRSVLTPIRALLGKELREQWAAPALGLFGLVMFLIIVLSMSIRIGFHEAFKEEPLFTWMVFLGTFIVITAFAGGLTSDRSVNGDSMVAMLPVRPELVWTVKIIVALVASTLALMIIAIPSILMGIRVTALSFQHRFQLMAEHFYLVAFLGHLVAASLVAGALFKRPIGAFTGSLTGLAGMMMIDVALTRLSMIPMELFRSARIAVWLILAILSLWLFRLRLRGRRGSLMAVSIALALCVIFAGVLGRGAYMSHYYGDLPDVETRLSGIRTGADRLLQKGYIPIKAPDSGEWSGWSMPARIREIASSRDILVTRRFDSLFSVSMSGRYVPIVRFSILSPWQMIRLFFSSHRAGYRSDLRIDDLLDFVLFDMTTHSTHPVLVPETLDIWPMDMIPLENDTFLVTWFERMGDRTTGFGRLDAGTGRLDIIETGWKGYLWVSDARDKILKWESVSPSKPEGYPEGLVYYDVRTGTWVHQAHSLDTPVLSPDGMYAVRGIRTADGSGCHLTVSGTGSDILLNDVFMRCRDLIESYVQWTPDSRHLVILARDAADRPRLVVWTPESGSLTTLLDDIDEGCGDLTVFELKVSPDGRRLAGARPRREPAGGEAGKARSAFMVDMEGRTHHELPGEGKPYGWLDSNRCLIDDPDGILVWSGDDGTVSPLFRGSGRDS